MADARTNALQPLEVRSADQLRAGLASEAQLWRLAADPVDEVGRYGPRLEALLSDEERGRRARLIDEREQARLAVAHGFKRLVLARTLGVAPAELRFEADENGKPALAADSLAEPGAEHPGFSLSHTQGCVAVLVSGLSRVGVDVQRITGVNDPLLVARTFGARQEREWLEGLPPAARCERFFELWGLREAYLKAHGDADLEPERFWFDLNRAPPAVGFAAGHDDDPAAWQLVLARPEPDLVLAAALRRGAMRTDLQLPTCTLRSVGSLLDPGGAR